MVLRATCWWPPHHQNKEGKSQLCGISLTFAGLNKSSKPWGERYKGFPGTKSSATLPYLDLYLCWCGVFNKYSGSHFWGRGEMKLAQNYKSFSIVRRDLYFVISKASRKSYAFFYFLSKNDCFFRSSGSEIFQHVKITWELFETTNAGAQLQSGRSRSAL